MSDNEIDAKLFELKPLPKIHYCWPHRFAPSNRAKVIVFYPQLFNGSTPDWARHFIAYVRGATGVQDLQDLGYEK
jgi:hypothetical protein